MCWNLDGQQFEQEHSGCVGDDLFDISEDHSCFVAHGGSRSS